MGIALLFTEADGFRFHGIDNKLEARRISVGNAFEPVVKFALQKREETDGRTSYFDLFAFEEAPRLQRDLRSDHIFVTSRSTCNRF